VSFENLMCVVETLIGDVGLVRLRVTDEEATTV
jgi:hypothetical protein